MTSYFEYRKIDELIEENDNSYRQEKIFTLNELSKYDGKNGKPAYVAIEGIVYDISNDPIFKEVKDMGIMAGKDLTEQFNLYYRMNQIINKMPKIGVIYDSNYIECETNRCTCKQAKEDTSEFMADSCEDYIESLVKCSEKKSKKNKSKKNKTKGGCKYTMPLNVLAGLDKILQNTINQVLELQTKISKCSETAIYNGSATDEEDVDEFEKISGSGGSAGSTFLAGGALGGAGGGLGVAANTGNSSVMNSGMEAKKGPGAIGGAAGGALGSTVPPQSTVPAPSGVNLGGVGGSAGRTETDDDERRDRLDIEN